jgi:hypothetical protein
VVVPVDGVSWSCEVWANPVRRLLCLELRAHQEAAVVREFDREYGQFLEKMIDKAETEVARAAVALLSAEGRLKAYKLLKQERQKPPRKSWKSRTAHRGRSVKST